jgi:hypothetical protein
VHRSCAACGRGGRQADLYQASDEITITLTLPADHLADIEHAAERIIDLMSTLNTKEPLAS